MAITTRLHPDWVLTGEGWQSHCEVAFDDGGLIDYVGPTRPGGLALPGRALMPGLVNGHSHAFQRLIRGRTEYRRADRLSDDFWSWRELMYQAALALDPDQLEKVARLLYLEMAEAGITTVGEFHYLHYRPDGGRYQNPDELALRLVEAARWVGLEVVLLRCAYHRSGFGQAANPLQIRFLDASWEEAAQAVERLSAQGLAVGLAPHSVRAVPPEWLAPLAQAAASRDWPLHMHVSEQPREIEQCLAETGRRPLQLLQEQGLLGPHFTAVHAIHLEAQEIAALAGSTVCSCPTTERNLGDGVVPAQELRAAGSHFCFGSDSQCQIDPWEDARQLDYHLRLIHRQRAVLDHPAGQLESWLLQGLTRGGSRSLGRSSGELKVGAPADLISLDLNHPQWGWRQPQGLLWAASSALVDQCWKGGRPLLQQGVHPRRAEAVAGFRQVMKECCGG